MDYPKWYNISLDTTPALHFHNNARLLTPFLCTWYDLWPFLTLHWRNVSTTEKCIIIVHRASSSPLLCPHLKPPTFHFFKSPWGFPKGAVQFSKAVCTTCVYQFIISYNLDFGWSEMGYHLYSHFYGWLFWANSYGFSSCPVPEYFLVLIVLNQLFWK